jgi:hypothetical protein
LSRVTLRDFPVTEKELVSIETQDDGGRLDGKEALSPAMTRRLKRAYAEEKVARPDPLIDDPSIDLDMYRRVMRLRMADFALSRHRIYLDMNYWIWLRDAAFRQPKLPIHAELWRRLRQLSKSGRGFCPVSYPVFAEVLKQNTSTRRRTACVVDRLCGGVCIVDKSSRVRVQLSHFVWTKLLGDQTLKPSIQYIWAPTSHFLGMGHAEMQNWPSEVNLKQQKLWLQFTQYLKFSDVFELMKELPPAERDNWRHTLLQNFMSDRTREQLRSLNATYKIEVGASTDIIAKDIADFAIDLFDKGIRSPLGPEASHTDLAASLASIITTGLTMGRITTDFPQYHIMGVIHATIRWMRRRYQVNDPMDHQHATAALPYCNAFFTERDLRDTLTRGPFHLDRAYGCHVISDPNEAVAYLEEIAGKTP